MKTTGKLETEISKLKNTIKEQDIKLGSLGAPGSATAYAAMGNFSAFALVVIAIMVLLALYIKRQKIAEFIKRNKLH